MEQRLLVLELEALDPLIHSNNYEFIIVIASWLIPLLDEALKDKINNVEFEAIKTYGKFGGAYPALGIYSDTIEYFDEDYKLIESTCEYLLREKSIIELVQFISDSKKDWSEITAKIMR